MQNQLNEAIQLRKKKAILKKARHHLIRKIFIILFILLIIFTFVIGVRIVPNNNMYPLAKKGDLIFFSRIVHNVDNNDIVLYREGQNLLIGRVVGTEGNTIDAREDGRLLLNGDIFPIDKENGVFYDTFIQKEQDKQANNVSYPYPLQKNQYLILNDNRERTNDSRNYGYVAKNEIKGSIFSIIRLHY